MKLKWPTIRHDRPAILVAAIAVTMTAPWLYGEPASPSPIAQLSPLANRGRFDQVLALLKSAHPMGRDRHVAALIQDLEQYQQHEIKRTQERQQAYEAALEEMVQQAKTNQLQKALASAIKALDLASDPGVMLRDAQVQDLVKQAETAATTAEDEGQWVEALAIYRALDLLFDDLSSYRDEVKRTSQHLRVLRLYAPSRLEQMYAARAARLGEEAPTQLNLGEETWEGRLKGINLAMLRQTLAQAARRHVENQGYGPLLAGALDDVIIMAQTKGLEHTFPSFNDPTGKLKRFRDRLIDLRTSLDQPQRPLNFLDAATAIERVLTINEQTVGLPESVLIYEMAEGATDTLDDFSTIIWPSDKEVFSRNTQGKFYGVGIQISIRDDQLIVVSPLEDTPAQRAGIKAGDIIATVEQRDTSGWTLDRAVREITGPEGTNVTLGIQRAGKSQLLDFVLTRAEIVIESIRGWQRKPTGGWNYFIDGSQRIGYVRLSQFIPQSATDLDRAINVMQDDGPLNGLILDLRFNPGGLLSSAVEVSDRFISNGPIVSTIGPDGKRTSQFRARADHTHNNMPLVVLINEGSASASEILSGALQDYQRALIIGTRSFGKGSVQDLFPLSGDKAYLKLTTQYYMLPGGRIIHRKADVKTWGIEPNLIVKMTSQQVADAAELRQEVDVLHSDANSDNDSQDAKEEPAPTANQILEKALDPQLEAALLVLKTRLLARQLALASGDWPATVR